MAEAFFYICFFLILLAVAAAADNLTVWACRRWQEWRSSDEQ